MAAILNRRPEAGLHSPVDRRGCGRHAKDVNGESVLDWALKYRNPEIIAMLKAAGAHSSKPFTAPTRPADFMPGTPKEAVARASALLTKSEMRSFPKEEVASAAITSL